MQQQQDVPGGSRRAVLKGCLAGCSAAALAGCASYGTPAAQPPDSAAPAAPEVAAGSAAPGTGTPSAEAGDAGAGSSPAAAAGQPAGPVLAALDDVPVGGALVLADAGVVLVRTEAGAVHGLSATCTHAGCAVTEVDDGVVVCPCHGSRFALADGSVVRGPAGRPLDRVRVRVEAGQVLGG